METVVNVHEATVVMNSKEVKVDDDRGGENGNNVQKHCQNYSHSSVVLKADKMPVEFPESRFNGDQLRYFLCPRKTGFLPVI